MSDAAEKPPENDGRKGGRDRDRGASILRRLMAPQSTDVPLPAWLTRTGEHFFPSDVIDDGDEKAFMQTSPLVRRGNLVVAFFVIGGFLLAAFVPLQSAIVAHGAIVVKTHRKTVQHLEGGIVKEIDVTDGEMVQAGQVLIRLDDTQAKANLSALEGEADAMSAQEARLVAERDGKDHIDFPADLLARKSDPTVAEAMRGEENAFEARASTLGQKVGILGQRNGENGRVIAGLKVQQEAVRSQLKLVEQEIAGVQSLYNEGLATLPRLLALQRQQADLSGQDGQITEKIAQAQLQNGENGLQISNVKDEQLSDIVQSLRDVQTKKYETMDRIHAIQDTIAHAVMRAPVSGEVMALSAHTVGAVIKPGDTVMELVPKDDTLQVEAQLKPEDADDVHEGMSARINLSAYQQRRLPMITGVVSSVSADSLTDQRTGQPYFSVELTVDRSTLKDYPDAQLIPGLPVEVEIGTGKRTMLDYLTEPVTEVMRHGLRER
ncbi:MAG TPA: HlyD family type I secretion periplasmic adaptor subunit [Rhizomicrobium sp.]|nr:HlyD family type I secretion periplasmic adaptor subunit [Rhizomicrobium sp.]